MTKRPVKYIIAVFVALALMLPAITQAADAPPPLAEMWMVTPKAGHGAEFTKAMAEHMAFRSEHGDPREWEVYTPVLGEDLNRYAIRFCCFSWADQDKYDAWQDGATEINEHFQENVIPHTDTWAHYFEAMDWGNSNWVQSDTEYRFYAVTEFNITPGEGQDFTEARTKMSQIAIDQGWANENRLWIWASTIGGKSQESIIIPHVNYASLDRGEETFLTFLSKHMGADEAAEMMEEFSASSWSTNFQIWEFQKSLSMSSDD
jgi:hypothetical protein